MKPKLKTFLIGYSYDVKSKFMWQNRDNKTNSLTVDLYHQPNITEALLEVKAKHHNVKFKSLQIVSISNLGLARVEMPDKDKNTLETLSNLNISTMKLENELGYDELVDTIGDVIELTIKLVDTAKDGIQMSDAFVLLAEAGNIEEIYKDAKTALEEFKDLTPEEAVLAEVALAERLNAEPGSVKDIIRQAFNLITRLYIDVTDVVAFAKQFKKAA